MIRLKLYILIFCMALSIPLAYFMLRAYHSLEQEELSELRYFSNTLFDQMEEELAVLIQKEEGRADKITGGRVDPRRSKAGEG